MNKEELIELIQLYSAGCIKKQDLQKLRLSMQEDENFPWLELSEYRNFVALLSVTLKSKDPSVNARNKVVYKMNELEKALLSDNNENDISEQMVQTAFTSVEKIDWGSLFPVRKIIQKSTDTISSDLKETYTQVQPPSKILTASILNFDEDSDETNNFDKESSIKDPDPQRRFKKYHIAIVGSFLSAILIGGYLYLDNSTEVKTEFPKVKTQSPKISIKEPEPDTTEKIIGFVSVGELEPIIEKESETQKQIQEELLPTPPPKTSSQVEYPPVKFVEYDLVEENKLTEETKTEDQKPVPPPPKEEIKVENEPSYFVAVEEMPEPIGGLKSIQEKIVYPEIARRVEVEGKVFVRAYVDEIGSVKRAEVIKGIGLGCDEAALDAVLNTKFKPGKQRGKPIKVQIIIPIVFKR
jgi:protein TonB